MAAEAMCFVLLNSPFAQMAAVYACHRIIILERSVAAG